MGVEGGVMWSERGEPGDSFTAASVRIAVGLIQGRVPMKGQKVDERSASVREEMVAAPLWCKETAKMLKESH